MKIIPCDLRVKGEICVVVGAGRLAQQAVRELASAGARVFAVAGRFPSHFPRCEHFVIGSYRRNHLKDAFLAVAASGGSVNAAVKRDARRAKIHLVAPAGRSKVHPPSTGAVSRPAPSRTRRPVRDGAVLAALGDEYAHLGRIISAVRRRAVDEIRDPRRRAAFFEALADDSFLETIRREGCERALAAAENLLENAISGREA